MKRLAVSLSIVLWTCFVCAQSNTSRFIDSPSWVLAKEKETAQAQTVPVQNTEKIRNAEFAEPSGRTEGMDADRQEPSGRSASAEAQKRSDEIQRNLASKSKGQSGQGMAPVAPKKEGFLHVGVYVTPVVNWLSSLNSPYKRSGVNICATPTVMLDMRMIGRLYLGVGAAFNTLGGRIDCPTINNVKQERSYMFSYVEIPVRLKWQTPNFGKSKSSLFLSGGLNLGFCVQYKYKDIYTGPLHVTNIGNVDGVLVDGVLKVKNTMKKDSRLVNLAAVAQFGYSYQILPRVNLIIGVEYHYGFIRPVKKGKYANRIDGLDKPIYNNQQCGLVLGVMF